MNLPPGFRKFLIYAAEDNCVTNVFNHHCVASKFAPMFPFNFRQMQLSVMDELLQTDKSFVFSAPTASGKTVLMELAMVRTLNTCHDAVNKPLVVYLAPLKSLCSEKFADWAKKGQRIGFSVEMLTGDSGRVNEYAVLKATDVLCCTSEKLDWLSRRFSFLFSSVRLLLLDEIHGISEENRGSALEALITRFKYFRLKKQPSLRIIAVSATIPNVDDLALWLGPNCRSAMFDESHRPVPLEKVVLGFQDSSQNPFEFDNMLNGRIPDILRRYSDNKPTLIFCMCRSSTENSAKSLSQRMPSDSPPDAILINTSQQVANEKLRPLITSGIAFHHSGLTMPDRALVEKLFLDGKIRALFSTSTLSTGVNLPAHLVVIKTTMFCTGEHGKAVEIKNLEFVQMTGRAGRPQFDTFGRVVVLTRNETRDRYRELFSIGHDLESGLLRRLGEVLNAEIAMNLINSKAVAIDWFQNSFLHVRLTKNLPFYVRRQRELTELSSSQLNASSASFNDSQGSNTSQSLLSATADEFLNSCVSSTVDTLKDIGLIKYQPGASFELQPTRFGHLMATHCIALGTMSLLIEAVSQDNVSLVDLFEILPKCDELSSVVLRVEEQPKLDFLAPLARFPIVGTVDPRKAKIWILMQTVLSGNAISDQSLAKDAVQFFAVSRRIASCFCDIAEGNSQSYKFVLAVNLFSQIMKAELWEDSSFISRQLPGIGPAYSRSLADAGFISFPQLAAASEAAIQAACARNPPFGRNVINDALAVPHYLLVLQQLEPISLISCTLRVSLRLTNFQRLRNRAYFGANHKLAVIIGDPSCDLVFASWRLTDGQLMLADGLFCKVVAVDTQAPTVCARLVSLEIVGVDTNSEIVPSYLQSAEGQPLCTSTPNRCAAKKRESDAIETVTSTCKLAKLSEFDSEDDESILAKLEEVEKSANFQPQEFDSEDDDSVLTKLEKLERGSPST